MIPQSEPVRVLFLGGLGFLASKILTNLLPPETSLWVFLGLMLPVCLVLAVGLVWLDHRVR